MLPMPEYTHPEGTLNMVSFLKKGDIRPDLGPKTYVAFGRCATVTHLPSRMLSSATYMQPSFTRTLGGSPGIPGPLAARDRQQL